MRVIRRRLVTLGCVLTAGFLLWTLVFRGNDSVNHSQPPTKAATVPKPVPVSAALKHEPSVTIEHSAPVHGGYVGDLAFKMDPLDAMDVVDGLGEGGLPATLSPSEQKHAERVMKKEAFNVVLSNKISLHRTVPDTRDPLCKQRDHPFGLPDATVVIIFTDEAWSALLRTVWSVLQRAQDHPGSVKEIILVDDFSSKQHLGQQLEDYIRNRFPPVVQLIRLKRREGLIRARLAGARLATGDVLVFLDSHCECGEDWLRPLLSRIQEDPKVFAVPIIDVIDDKTLEYYQSNGNYFQIGGFTWMGHFTWIDIPNDERRESQIDPLRTPTMAGGLFAVKRSTFWELGSYDEDMDVWGGENLEMSFRVWQCGGSVETVPCSRVGHIFRNFHPYTFPGDKDTHGINTARTVEVWMDDYKDIFYLHRPDLLQVDIETSASVSNSGTSCSASRSSGTSTTSTRRSSFPNSPDHVSAFGRVRNEGMELCLDTLQNEDKDQFQLGVFQCNDVVSSTQFFSLSNDNSLRHEDSCAEVEENDIHNGDVSVNMKPCESFNQNQKFKKSAKGRIMHLASKRCLGVSTVSGTAQLVTSNCKRSPSQLWNFDEEF